MSSTFLTPAAGRQQADRRQGRLAPLPQPGPVLAARLFVWRDCSPCRGVVSTPTGQATSTCWALVGPLRVLAQGFFDVIDFRSHLVSIIAIFFASPSASPWAPARSRRTSTDPHQQVGEAAQDTQELRQQVTDQERQSTYARHSTAGWSGAHHRPPAGRARRAGRAAWCAQRGVVGPSATACGRWRERAGDGVRHERWPTPTRARCSTPWPTELVSEGTTLPECDGYDREAALLDGALVSIDPTGAASVTAPARPRHLAPGRRSSALAGLGEGFVTVEGDPTGPAHSRSWSPAPR